MKRILVALLFVTLFFAFVPVFAQDDEPKTAAPELLLYTPYPSQTMGIGESVTLDLNLRTGDTSQVVTLEVEEVPENWSVAFRGGGRIVHSVFVQPDEEASVELRIEPPINAEPGTYNLVAVARGEDAESQLPIQLIIEEKAPASLAFEVELPMLRGRPSTTFRYNVTLKNEGGENLTVNLFAQAPPVYNVTFKSGTNEVTSIPLEADESERLSVEVAPLLSVIPANTYPIIIGAQAGDVQATAELAAEVVGQSTLDLKTPDDRLSGDAQAGETTSIALILQNTGSASARNVDLSASSPSGWTVEFDPSEIEEIQAGQQIEITANVRPAEKAIAGDYELTFRARPEDGSTESVEYRVTVRTSTLWGAAGVGLIAVAVVVVGAAVMRFGRR